MSAIFLRYSVCLKNFAKLSNASHTFHRTLNTVSSNSCSNAKVATTAAAAAAATAQQRKIEVKEPIGIDKVQNGFANDVSNGDIVPVFKRALLYGNKTAIKDNTGEYSYRQLLDGARKLATELSAHSQCKCDYRSF